MSQRTFLILFILANILLLFVYIHKQNWLIQITYTKQKNEKILADLEHHKKELYNSLQAKKDRSAIRTTAQSELQLQKARLRDIQSLRDDHE